VPSMSRVGSALDSERHFRELYLHSFKSEIGASRHPDRQTARASIFEFIELFYNRVHGATRHLGLPEPG
jgi:hypothetical protein